MDHIFVAGELVAYVCGDIVEIGKIKRVTDRGAFVWYHEGDTASLTPFDKLLPVRNAYCIAKTTLGSLK